MKSLKIFLVLLLVSHQASAILPTCQYFGLKSEKRSSSKSDPSNLCYDSNSSAWGYIADYSYHVIGTESAQKKVVEECSRSPSDRLTPLSMIDAFRNLSQAMQELETSRLCVIQAQDCSIGFQSVNLDSKYPRNFMFIRIGNKYSNSKTAWPNRASITDTTIRRQGEGEYPNAIAAGEDSWFETFLMLNPTSRNYLPAKVKVARAALDTLVAAKICKPFKEENCRVAFISYSRPLPHIKIHSPNVNGNFSIEELYGPGDQQRVFDKIKEAFSESGLCL